MGFDDEKKLLMKSKTFELKKKYVGKLRVAEQGCKGNSRTLEMCHVRERGAEDKQ